MRSPSILGVKESSFGSDMQSIATLKTTYCKEESDSSCGEQEMESNAVKTDNISIDKDSGIDSDNDFKAPDSELMLKIVAQVESYFSDENLMKDEFVLKHIRRNKDGFISLKLLSSFRKVKALTKNWKVVAVCVRNGSKKLELNEDQTKIRRKTPLPPVDGDKYSRTVIAYNSGVATEDINNISKVFSQFGDIALIRILKSGSSAAIPQNLLKKIKDECDLSHTTVATIEYVNKSDAEKALKSMEQNATNDWRNSIRVMSMKSTNKSSNTSSNMSSNMSSNISNENQKNKTSDNRDNQRSYQKKSIKQNSNKINVCLDINNIPNKRNLFSRQKSKSYSSGDESRVLNRLPKSDKMWTKPQFTCHQKGVSIIREPRGPDGTNGFNSNKNHRSPTI